MSKDEKGKLEGIKRYYNLPYFGQRLVVLNKEKGTATLIDETTQKPLLETPFSHRDDLVSAIRAAKVLNDVQGRMKSGNLKIFDVDFFTPENTDVPEADPRNRGRKASPKKKKS